MTKIEFTAKLVLMGPGGAWVFVYLPKSASKKLRSRARVPIRGTIKGFAFRSLAFPMGDGTHNIQVNKTMQAGTRAKPEDSVHINRHRSGHEAESRAAATGFPEGPRHIP